MNRTIKGATVKRLHHVDHPRTHLTNVISAENFGRRSKSCPLHALTQWLHDARIDFGPIFVAGSRNGLKATGERLSDKHVARLIKQTVENAGLRPALSKAERLALYSGHSLRAGLASSAEVDERFVQKQLGHASAKMTCRYQRRRDRFRVNPTKAAGL
jgi:integrase